MRAKKAAATLQHANPAPKYLRAPVQVRTKRWPPQDGRLLAPEFPPPIRLCTHLPRLESQRPQMIRRPLTGGSLLVGGQEHGQAGVVHDHGEIRQAVAVVVGHGEAAWGSSDRGSERRAEPTVARVHKDEHGSVAT